MCTSRTLLAGSLSTGLSPFTASAGRDAFTARWRRDHASIRGDQILLHRSNEQHSIIVRVKTQRRRRETYHQGIMTKSNGFAQVTEVEAKQSHWLEHEIQPFANSRSARHLFTVYKYSLVSERCKTINIRFRVFLFCSQL